MRFNFWQNLRDVIASVKIEPKKVVIPQQDSGFPIHPSASELAEQMLVDPSVLENETYEPGIYDESGDYYPQFTDDPSALPEHFEPAPLGDAVPEPAPGSDSKESPAPDSAGGSDKES